MMLNFLHTYHPNPIIFQIGRIGFYWYGFFIILAAIIGLSVALNLARLYQTEKERIIDLSFLLIIFGVGGARLFAILYNFDYFLKHPLDILKVWQGGMSIHGALIAGIIVLFFYARRHKISFWLLADLFVPALALGQALGRWGNYFNQELYGRPTSLPFSIPISFANRVGGFENFNYFHPVFFYEFILDLIIFGILIWLHKRNLKFRNSSAGSSDRSPNGEFSQNEASLLTNQKTGFIFFIYLILYSIIRFSLEFLRIDPQPVIFHLRLAQWISLLIIAISFVIIIMRTPCFLYQTPKKKLF